MRDTSESLPDFIATRSKVRGGLADFNVELGLLTKRTFNSNSTGVASNNISGAISGTGIIGEAIQHEPPPCFIGTTLFTLWDRTQISFAELYENQDKHKYCLSFSDKPIQGKIFEVFRNTVYEYLNVTFDDGVSGVVAEHRYYVPEGGYVCIKDLMGQLVVNEYDGLINVQSFEKVVVPEGILVYNAHTSTGNYCADSKRVHNRKPDPP